MIRHSQAAIGASSFPSASLKRHLAHRGIVARWLSLGLLIIAVVLFLQALPSKHLVTAIQTGISGLGMWAPMAMALVYVLAALLFIPGSLLTLAAGAVFGFVVGTIVVSVASTTAAALAFLIARYLARDKVRHRLEASPKLRALDEAIGDQGWKIVALLRLSPAVPFNLQNYFYGVTAIRFWPCLITSWVTMLPGAIVYTYIGSLGRVAVDVRHTSAGEWVLRGVGLLATVAVMVYLAKLARNAIRERTAIDETNPNMPQRNAALASHDSTITRQSTDRSWGTCMIALIAVVVFALSLLAFAKRDVVRQHVESLLQGPRSGSTIR